MRRIARPGLVATAMLLAASGLEGQAPGNPRRAALEAAYAALLEAAAAGDVAGLERTVAAATLAAARAQLAKARRVLDRETARAFTEDFPDLHRLEHLRVFTAGASAALLYRGPADPEPDGTPLVTFVYLKFVEEGGGWRYAGLLTRELPKLGADGTPTEFSLDMVPEVLRP